MTRALPMPSLATLEQIHDADHAAMRRILKMTPKEVAELHTQVSAVNNCRDTDEMRMRCLDIPARTHGVEVMRARNGWYADYLNTGDMYAPTVIYWNGRFRVQSVGDFVETMERNGIKFD